MQKFPAQWIWHGFGEEDLTLLGKEPYHVHQNEKVFLREYVPGAAEGSTPVDPQPTWI